MLKELYAEVREAVVLACTRLVRSVADALSDEADAEDTEFRRDILVAWTKHTTDSLVDCVMDDLSSIGEAVRACAQDWRETWLEFAARSNTITPIFEKHGITPERVAWYGKTMLRAADLLEQEYAACMQASEEEKAGETAST